MKIKSFKENDPTMNVLTGSEDIQDVWKVKQKLQTGLQWLPSQ